jgi:hypothetical protein
VDACIGRDKPLPTPTATAWSVMQAASVCVTQEKDGSHLFIFSMHRLVADAGLILAGLDGHFLLSTNSTK